MEQFKQKAIRVVYDFLVDTPAKDLASADTISNKLKAPLQARPLWADNPATEDIGEICGLLIELLGA
eukprot:12911802-Prorocentrum_lima.AAC.1